MPKERKTGKRRAAQKPRRRRTESIVSKSAALKSRAHKTGATEATLAALAHDIRTPLTGILALSELLTTAGLGERERGWATAIKGTAEHLAMVTSLIVDAARAKAKGLVLRRTLFRPRQLAEAVGASLAARA